MLRSFRWVRLAVVVLVVLSTVLPRFYFQSGVGSVVATEYKWDGSEKTDSARELDFTSCECWGAGAAPCVAGHAREAERVLCDAKLHTLWAIQIRELPARAPPAIL